MDPFLLKTLHIAGALGVFTGGTVWTVVYSFTDSKLLPRTKWVGLAQYVRLWGEDRWIISIIRRGSDWVDRRLPRGSGGTAAMPVPAWGGAIHGRHR